MNAWHSSNPVQYSISVVHSTAYSIPPFQSTEFTYPLQPVSTCSGCTCITVNFCGYKFSRRKKKERLTKFNGLFFEHLVLTCTIVLMNDLGLVRCTICWRFWFSHLEISENYLFWDIWVFVMYYIYGISWPSLLIESTDSMITIPTCKVQLTKFSFIYVFLRDPLVSFDTSGSMH